MPAPASSTERISVAVKLHMASVFVKDGRLILQLRIRGVQLREALHLRDTAANRKWAEGECTLIERELVTGTFDYWIHFPQSRSAKAKAMFPRRDRPEDLTTETWVRHWLAQVEPRWGSGMAYDVKTMVDRHIGATDGASALDRTNGGGFRSVHGGVAPVPRHSGSRHGTGAD